MPGSAHCDLKATCWFCCVSNRSDQCCADLMRTNPPGALDQVDQRWGGGGSCSTRALISVQTALHLVVAERYFSVGFDC